MDFTPPAYVQEIAMTTKQEVRDRAVEARRDLRSLERTIAWGKQKAEAEGNVVLYGALVTAGACAKALHRSLEAVMALAGDHFKTGDFAAFSGGDDKPDDEPPPPPPPPGGP
jgi:hypothetical protein